MKLDFPFFDKVDVAGFTRAELDAVADLARTPGWQAVKKYLGELIEPVRPAVYSNTDPEKQLLLHQGLGIIYVASNLEDFVSSAKDLADRLLQQEESARTLAEHPDDANADAV